MFDWNLFPHTDFNKVNLEWILDCLKALMNGNKDQILSKKSDSDFDFIWIDNTGGGSGGTSDYNALENKPSINGSTLQGNKTPAQLGLVGAEVGKQLSTNDYTNADKDKLDSIVFVTQSSTFAEVNTAYTAGKKVIFFHNGELFDVVEKPNNNTYRFVHVNSGSGVRTAVITSGGSWTLATAANPGSYIKYTSQSLSDAQKAQARTNIGAVSVSDYNPDAKTDAMTQAVGKDSNGKLWTAPGGGGGGGSFELLKEVTTTEDVAFLNFDLEQDCEEIAISIYGRWTTETTGATVALNVCSDNTYSQTGRTNCFAQSGQFYNNNDRGVFVTCRRLSQGRYMSFVCGNIVPSSTGVGFGDANVGTNLLDAITPNLRYIHIGSFNTSHLYKAGLVVRIWGR